MHKIRVGILRGGPSNEYDISLKTGLSVLKEISNDKYLVKDILIDRDGVWYYNGVSVKPHDVLSHIDVVFNALHGKYGEDGKVQHILEVHGIPFTGSKSFASAISMNKHLAKEFYERANIKTPQWIILNKNEDFLKTFKAFALPVVIKPSSSGSSVGISIVKNISSFEKAIKEAFEHSDFVLVEEYIQGREATCGVIDCFRDQEFYALPPIEIKTNNSFFDYEAKYAGKSEGIVPSNFSHEQKKQIEELSIKAHNILGLRHYSRSDFIVHPKRGIFILETNTLPGLTEESLIPKALKSVGVSLYHFLDHVLELALHRK